MIAAHERDFEEAVPPALVCAEEDQRICVVPIKLFALSEQQDFIKMPA